MNLQQLKIICETNIQHFNLTKVSQVLHTSQPGISKSIIELEAELGYKIFVRNGKKLIGFTAEGGEVLKYAQRIIIFEQNIKNIASINNNVQFGFLTIATTHTQARYILPKIIEQFKKDFPNVNLEILQCSPYEIGQLLIDRKADIGIATEALDQVHRSEDGLLKTFPYFEWHHALVVPKKHPLTKVKKLKLADIAKYPIVTYNSGITGRKVIDKAFARENIVPNVILTALDADVIKTYVELGLGVGLMASVAFDKEKDTKLKILKCDHLFSVNTSRIAILKGSVLRHFAYRFIELCSSELNESLVRNSLEI